LNRGRRARKAATKKKNETERQKAAVTIQKIARGKQAHAYVKKVEKKKLEVEKAVKLQAWMRTGLAKKRVATLRVSHAKDIERHMQLMECKKRLETCQQKAPMKPKTEAERRNQRSIYIQLAEIQGNRIRDREEDPESELVPAKSIVEQLRDMCHGAITDVAPLGLKPYDGSYAPEDCQPINVAQADREREYYRKIGYRESHPEEQGHESSVIPGSHAPRQRRTNPQDEKFDRMMDPIPRKPTSARSRASARSLASMASHRSSETRYTEIPHLDIEETLYGRPNTSSYLKVSPPPSEGVGDSPSPILQGPKPPHLKLGLDGPNLRKIERRALRHVSPGSSLVPSIDESREKAEQYYDVKLDGIPRKEAIPEPVGGIPLEGVLGRNRRRRGMPGKKEKVRAVQTSEIYNAQVYADVTYGEVENKPPKTFRKGRRASNSSGVRWPKGT